MKSPSPLAAATLTAVTIFVFAPTLGHGFINYDDGAYVTENTHVLDGLSWETISWAFSFSSTEATSNWHPLTWLSHMADVSLFGENPSRMHLVNLFLHLANVLLLYAALVKMTHKVWPSFFVAIVFAIHPLHVESVVWISERKDLLSTFFVLLAILSHLHFTIGNLIRWQVAAVVFFILSLMSKQMYVTLPFLLLLLDYWPLNRLETFTQAGILPQKSLRTLIIEKLPFFFVTVVFCVVAFSGQSHGGAVGSLEDYSIPQRSLNALTSYTGYIWQTLWPMNLAVFYPYPKELPWLPAMISLLILTTITLGVIELRTRHPYVMIGWFWYLGTLVPVIGLVQIGRQRMADRYMYFPMIGLLIAVVWLVLKWAKDQQSRHEILKIVGVVIVVGLAFLARNQSSYWKDSVTLFTHAAEVSESSLASTKLGYEQAQLGELDAARKLFLHALQLDPDYVSAHSSLGNTYLAQGEPQKAIRHFERAIKLDPSYAEAQYNLGITYSWRGDLEKSVKHYNLALKIDPNNANIHANLGTTYLMIKQDSEALVHLQKAIEIDPDLVEAHFALGNVLSSLKKNSDAIKHFEIVLKTRPNANEVHRELARLYTEEGNTQLATTHRELAEKDPAEEQP